MKMFNFSARKYREEAGFDGTDDGSQDFEENEGEDEGELDALTVALMDENEPVEKNESEPVKPSVVEPEKVKLTVAGEEKELTIDELKASYLRQADYTRKTQELSAERRQVEAAQAQYTEYLQSIPLLASQAQKNIQQAQEFINSPAMIELAQNDPAEYIANKAKAEAFYAENVTALQQMDRQYTEFDQQRQQAAQTARATMIAESNAKLLAEMPEWSKPEVKQAISAYALSDGYLPEEINNTIDHRFIKTLNKARLYDEMVKNSSLATKRVKDAPQRVVSSGADIAQDASFQTRKQQAIKRGDPAKIESLLAEALASRM
jgi:hypothetical protein